MSESCNIHIKENKNDTQYITIYKHQNGSFAGVGKQLKNKFKSYKIVNGISEETPKQIANGIGCFAAQVVTFLKTKVGDVYLIPSNNIGTEEHEYILYVKDNKINIVASSSESSENLEIMYDGPLANFMA